MANRNQLYKYLGNKCASCGLSVDEMVKRHGTFDRMFELHHIVPETKDSNYKNLIERNISVEQIAEVDKCVLLCRNCHGIIHAQNIKGKVKVILTFDDKEVFQYLNGWFVKDSLDKTITFVTNDRILLEPCWVKVGCEKEKIFCMLELHQENRLFNWINNISVHKKIEVRSRNKEKLLLCIEHIKENRVQVRQSLEYTELSMDFDVSEGDSSYLWIRNGMVLTKEGKVITSGEVSYPLDLFNNEKT